MNINFENYADIPLEPGEDLPTNMVCVCGHTLKMHAFTMSGGGINTGQCVSCECKKFSWSGKYEKKDKK